MRRPTSALASAFFGTALAASTVLAQQSPRLPASSASGTDARGGASSSNLGAIPLVGTGPRAPRLLLRNGWDYVAYQEYDRALVFFREAELRKKELNDAEQLKLKQGIERAQRGIREASVGMNNEPSYSRSNRSKAPGAMALAPPSGRAQSAKDRDSIQLAGGPAAAARSTNAANVRASYPGDGIPSSPAALPTLPDDGPPPVSDPLAARTASTPAAAPNLMPTPASAPDPLTANPATAPTPAPATAATPASEDPPLPTLPTELTGEPTPAPLPKPAAAPAPAEEKLPTLPTSLGGPTETAPAPPTAPSAPAPEVEKLPSLPDGLAAPTAPATTPDVPPSSLPDPMPVPAPATSPASSVPSLPDSPPPPEAPPIPEAPLGSPAMPSTESVLPPAPLKPSTDSLIPYRAAAPPSSLTPELQREVQRIAQKQDEDMKRNPFMQTTPGVEVGSDNPTGTIDTSKLVISRAPSPTEARPIRAIPVPEEFVPLPKRDWDPNRKYWAAAATCHFPLYFQDATLERYGYGTEQRFGTFGRFLSYPIDDPKQSKQRNQLAQPFISCGLFAAQIVLLPYHMLMDPPWESEYDLGFYRPGDRVPTDVLYLPLTGVGPPLGFNHYGAPPTQSRW